MIALSFAVIQKKHACRAFTLLRVLEWQSTYRLLLQCIHSSCLTLVSVTAGAEPFQTRRQRASALFERIGGFAGTASADDEVAAVERAISSVEKDIAEATAEIADVKRAMRSGKEYLGMQGKDLIEYLSKQLKEKEQLRKKEEQLRDEKSESACCCS